jgi:hypothetical protein
VRAEAVKSSADAAAREQLAKVVEVLVADKVASFEDCIAWARLKFQVRRRRCDLQVFAVYSYLPFAGWISAYMVVNPRSGRHSKQMHIVTSPAEWYENS